MRNTDCYRLAKILLPQLPGFATNKQNEIFISPIGNILRGFVFDSSAYSRQDFYFSWFAMPICRPIEYITLSPSKRLDVPGGDTGWRIDMPDLPDKLLEAMRHEAIPLLHSIQTNQDMIELIFARQESREVTDINDQDEIACLQILDGKFDEASIMIEQIIAHEHGPYRYQWILNIVERMKVLRAKLHEDPQLAVAQVKEWQDYTFKALKLEKWR
jgi:hypothetical protein